MNTNNPITLVIADDENIFKKGLKLSLKKFPRIGEASDSTQLRQLVAEKHPDIILADVEMNGADIVAEIRKIVRQTPSSNIIVLSHQQEDSLIVNVLEAGACGYLLKDVSDCELYTAIQEVQNGSRYYCKKISDKVMKFVTTKGYNRAAKRKPLFTETEKQIIEFICKEKTSKEISNELYLSMRTVEGHRLNIGKKIGAKSSVGIALYAIKNGLHKIQWQLDLEELFKGGNTGF
jgi:DNA-binding NarL/FixJ family response regulator